MRRQARHREIAEGPGSGPLRLRYGLRGLVVRQERDAIGTKFDRPGEIGILINADENLVEDWAGMRRDGDRPDHQVGSIQSGGMEQRPRAGSVGWRRLKRPDLVEAVSNRSVAKTDDDTR